MPRVAKPHFFSSSLARKEQNSPWATCTDVQYHFLRAASTDHRSAMVLSHVCLAWRISMSRIRWDHVEIEESTRKTQMKYELRFDVFAKFWRQYTRRSHCRICDKRALITHPFGFGKWCGDCFYGRNPLSIVNLRRARSEFKLRNEEVLVLPHHSMAVTYGMMCCFLRKDVIALCRERYGDNVPHRIPRKTKAVQ